MLQTRYIPPLAPATIRQGPVAHNTFDNTPAESQDLPEGWQLSAGMAFPVRLPKGKEECADTSRRGAIAGHPAAGEGHTLRTDHRRQAQ